MWQSKASSMANNAEPWLDFPSSEVSRIVVADSSNTSTLELKDGQWRLTDPALPANDGKINTLLTTLDGLDTTWPVVSTAAGRERFEVTEDKHQKQLSLFKGDTLLGEYYFGTSPGFRKTHARRADDDDVYALTFNNFDLPADSNDWLDKSLLSAKDPVAIEGADFALTKTGETWQIAAGSKTAGTVAAPANAPAINADAAKKFVDALANLHVLRVADDVGTKTPAGEPVVIDVKTGETSLTYRFTKVDATCYVQRSDVDHTFTLAEPDYKAIAGQSLAGLSAPVATPATDPQPAAASPATNAPAPSA
jgi:hypothetical protein